METDEEKKLKGYCFVEFKDSESAEKAVQQLNDYTPDEWSSSLALKVMSKQQWLCFKQEVALIRQELATLTSSLMFAPPEEGTEFEGFTADTLLRI